MATSPFQADRPRGPGPTAATQTFFPDPDLAEGADAQTIARWQRTAALHFNWTRPLASMTPARFREVIALTQAGSDDITPAFAPGSEAAAAFRESLARLPEGDLPRVDPQTLNDRHVWQEIRALPEGVRTTLTARLRQAIGNLERRGLRTQSAREEHDRLELAARMTDSMIAASENARIERKIQPHLPATLDARQIGPGTVDVRQAGSSRGIQHTRRFRPLRARRVLAAFASAPKSPFLIPADRAAARAEESELSRQIDARARQQARAGDPTPSRHTPVPHLPDGDALRAAGPAQRAAGMLRCMADRPTCARFAEAMDRAQAAFAVRGEGRGDTRRHSLWTVDSGVDALLTLDRPGADRDQTIARLTLTRHYLHAGDLPPAPTDPTDAGHDNPAGRIDRGTLTLHGQDALDELLRCAHPIATGTTPVTDGDPGVHEGRPASLHLFCRGAGSGARLRGNLTALVFDNPGLDGSDHDIDTIGRTPANDPDPRARGAVSWVRETFPGAAAATLAETAALAKTHGREAAKKILQLPEIAERADRRKIVRTTALGLKQVMPATALSAERRRDLVTRASGAEASPNDADVTPVASTRESDTTASYIDEGPAPEDLTPTAAMAGDGPPWETGDLYPADSALDHSPYMTDLGDDGLDRTPPAPGRDPSVSNPTAGLNREQARAATAPSDRHTLVLSRAGTGKTRTITARYAHLVAQGQPAGRVVALAFNKKASDELAERLQAAGGESSGRPRTKTFHALGGEIVRRHLVKAAGLAKTPEAPLSGGAVIREVAAALRTSRPKTNPGKASEVARQIEDWQHRGLDPQDVFAELRQRIDQLRARGGARREINQAERETAAAQVYAAYQTNKARAGLIDYGDMLLLPAVHLRRDPQLRQEVAKGIDHVLVDEFQDINDVQKQFIDHLAAGGARIFAVGDDLQSIYGFRNAEVGHILKFADEHPDATRVVLKENYRNTPEILAIANTIASGVQRRAGEPGDPVALETGNAAGVRPRSYGFADRGREAAAIADALAAHLSRPGDTAESRARETAVLAPTHDVLNAVETELARRDIPHRVQGKSYWEAPEIQGAVAHLNALVPADAASARTAVARLLEALPNPPARSEAEAAVAGAKQPLDATVIQALPEGPRRDAETAFAAIKTAREQLIGGRNAGRVLDDLMTATGYKAAQTPQGPDSQEALNLHRLVTLVANEPNASSGVPQAQAAAARIGRTRDHARQQDADTPAVTLSTIHSAKGLEWDTVVLAGCEQGRLPHKSAHDIQAHDEQRRLAYVATTRGRHTLAITYSQADGGLSSYIADDAREHVDPGQDLARDLGPDLGRDLGHPPEPARTQPARTGHGRPDTDRDLLSATIGRAADPDPVEPGSATQDPATPDPAREDPLIPWDPTTADLGFDAPRLAGSNLPDTHTIDVTDPMEARGGFRLPDDMLGAPEDSAPADHPAFDLGAPLPGVAQEDPPIDGPEPRSEVGFEATRPLARPGDRGPERPMPATDRRRPPAWLDPAAPTDADTRDLAGNDAFDRPTAPPAPVSETPAAPLEDVPPPTDVPEGPGQAAPRPRPPRVQRPSLGERRRSGILLSLSPNPDGPGSLVRIQPPRSDSVLVARAEGVPEQILKKMRPDAKITVKGRVEADGLFQINFAENARPYQNSSGRNPNAQNQNAQNQNAQNQNAQNQNAGNRNTQNVSDRNVNERTTSNRNASGRTRNDQNGHEHTRRRRGPGNETR